MKQTLYTTSNRAKELTREVLAMWRSAEMRERFEGIEDDPVFSLFMMALAYQANEVDNDIERLKSDITNDFAKMMVPDAHLKPIPATTLLKTELNSNMSEMEIDSNHSFNLKGSSFHFLSLMKSRIVNAQVKSIIRMDGRIWKVRLGFKDNIHDLNGISFFVANNNFQDLSVTIGSKPVALTKPWDNSDLPLSSCFSMDNMIYNRRDSYNATTAWFDLFAKQNSRLFYFKDSVVNSKSSGKIVTDVDLVFEFFGINEDFVFDRSTLLLNVLPLVNVEIKDVDISSTSPLVRICGDKNVNGNNLFMNLVRPNRSQLYRDSEIITRTIDADRFSLDSLIRLSNVIMDKFSSDFYAYQTLPQLRSGSKIQQLHTLLSSITNELNQQKESSSSPGIYLMLKRKDSGSDEHVSVNVKYLTTSASTVNRALSSSSIFSVPTELNPVETRVVGEPLMGHDVVDVERYQSSITKYHIITNDRLVTAADIKIFCYNELLTRYNISQDMVESVRISRRQNIENISVGYEVVVEIILADNQILKRSFQDKLPHCELLLQKMIEVRSIGILPVNLSIYMR